MGSRGHWGFLALHGVVTASPTRRDSPLEISLVGLPAAEAGAAIDLAILGILGVAAIHGREADAMSRRGSVG